MKRALITGASGLVGRAVMSGFRAAPDWEALGLGWSRASGDLRGVDITDRGALEATISEFKVAFPSFHGWEFKCVMRGFSLSD